MKKYNYELYFYNRKGKIVRSIIVPATGRILAINKYLRKTKPKTNEIRVKVVDDEGAHSYVLSLIEEPLGIRYKIKKVN